MVAPTHAHCDVVAEPKWRESLSLLNRHGCERHSRLFGKISANGTPDRGDINGAGLDRFDQPRRWIGPARVVIDHEPGDVCYDAFACQSFRGRGAAIADQMGADFQSFQPWV